ncbi:MAG: NAD-dependent epimerase/dehydratase family protein [Steroidobacteraceae bacterium]
MRARLADMPGKGSRALVTGAAGFIGAQLCPILAQHGWQVVCVSRRAGTTPRIAGLEGVLLPLSSRDANWQEALTSVRCVVHLAAHVHQLRDDEQAAVAYREVNVSGSRFVAEQAARAGVRRFVYLSSIKVNGEGGAATPYRAEDAPNPLDLYGRSKWEAEIALRDLCHRSGMELVIIRPPLVYGPRVRANFNRLMHLASLGVPLPLGSIDNRRSLVNVWNLADFIETCMTHPRAAGNTFLISDGEDLSTPQLLRKLSGLMHRPSRLFRFPPRALLHVARLIGFGPEMRRLCESLRLDSTPARERLEWQPVVSLDEGLARTVAAYREARDTATA